MAFVNEYVSAEDVKNYRLDDLWVLLTRDTPLQYIWTIDRDVNAFLISYAHGRDALSNNIDFALVWDGEIHRAALEKNNDRLDGVENITTTWNLIGIEVAPNSKNTRENVIQLLKEALKEYRLSGVVIPVKTHTAVFRF